jgi:NADPH2:quinone reductase
MAYAMAAISSYAPRHTYPAERLLRLPVMLSLYNAASILFKGVTAKHLIKETYFKKPDSLVLVCGADGAFC